MKCPCCGKEMTKKCIDDTHYDMCWGEGTPDYHLYYKCKECKISFDENEGWTVPKKYVATISEKQINCLCYLYDIPRNDYSSYKYVPVFDRYVPGVMSKEFASLLIQEKTTERKSLMARRNKEHAFNVILEKYGINPCFTYNGYYVQKHEGYEVRIRIDRDPILIHLDDIDVHFTSIITSCKTFDAVKIMQNLCRLASDLEDLVESK